MMTAKYPVNFLEGEQRINMSNTSKETVIPQTERMRFDISLAEFNTLRSEQLELIKIQYQLYNYLIVITVALSTLLITLISKGETIPNVFYPLAFWLVLIFPMFSAQACFLFFDQELVIHAIGSHIDKSLYPRIKHLIKDPLDWSFHEFWVFKDLNISTRGVHHTLYKTRWILFLIPVYGSTFGIMLHSFINWGWWNKYLDDGNRYWLMGLAVLILLVNIYLCACLYKIVSWTLNKHRNTKSDLVKSGEFSKIVAGGKFNTKFLIRKLRLDLFQPDIDLGIIAEINSAKKSRDQK